MALSRNTQYIAAGLIAVYIVFFTRPAPPMVVGLLASPLAQILALAGVVYVGASLSLLVALLLAVAVVLSIPAREYQTNMTTADKVASSEMVSAEDKKMYKEKCGKDKKKENEDKCAEIEALVSPPKPDVKLPEPGSNVMKNGKAPTSAIQTVKPAEPESKKEPFANARDETLDGHPF
jgi:uncharacterized low-complexity protein